MLTNNFNPHQADPLYRGISYQLYYTILAWLELKDGDILWIEVSEDFTITSEAATHDVQVKRLAVPISLRTPGVRDAIDRFWKVSAGGTRPHRLTILARSGAARERGSTLPAGRTALDYWFEAAQVADTKPLRETLIDVFADTALGVWIATNPDDAVLRDRLLRRITFVLNSLEDTALAVHLRDRLGALYRENYQFSSAAELGLASLVRRVLAVAGLPSADQRLLTRTDLYIEIEKVLSSLADLGQLAALREATEERREVRGSLVVTEHKLRPGVIERRQLVKEINTRFQAETCIWIKGANGNGKSTLASLLATDRGGRWIHCDVRQFSAKGNERGILSAWAELMSALNRCPNVSGIILDDLSFLAADRLKDRLAGLSAMLKSRGAQLIVTSNHSPSGALLTHIGLSEACVIEAPYFSLDDVIDLVAQKPAPPGDRLARWAEVVYVTAANGHPILAAAKISSLRHRNWPDTAFAEDARVVVNAGLPDAYDEARQRLLAELTTAEEREMLARLSTVYYAFDEALVRKLCRAQPPVAHPGDALVRLKGSWIEPLPEGQFRLSPLILDLQADVPPDDATRWRRLAAEHWMERSTLNQHTLSFAFWNGWFGRHLEVMLDLSQLILKVPPETWRAIVTVLSPLAFFDTDRPLWPESPEVAAVIRLVQIRVADAIEDQAIATEATQACLREIDSVKAGVVREYITITAVSICLDLENVRIPPALLLALLLRTRAVFAAGNFVLREEQAASAATPRTLAATENGESQYVARFLSGVRDSQELVEVIDALDAIDADVRKSWMDFTNRRHMVVPWGWIHLPWIKERSANQHPVAAAGHYKRIAATVAKWNEPALDDEVSGALSAMSNLERNELSICVSRARFCRALRAGHIESALTEVERIARATGPKKSASNESSEDVRARYFIDILLMSAFQGTLTDAATQRLATAIKTAYGDKDGERLLSLLEIASRNTLDLARTSYELYAAVAGSLMDEASVTRPTLRFKRDVYLFHCVAGSGARLELEPLIVRYWQKSWQAVLERQRAMLSPASRNVAAAERAIEVIGRKGLQGAGQFFAAFAAACGVSISAGWNMFFERVGAGSLTDCCD